MTKGGVSMSKTISMVSQAISTISTVSNTVSTISSIESISISLWLSIGRTLAISIPGISQTMTIAKGRVAMSKAISMSISNRVSTVSNTISTIAISSIESISFWFSLSLTLGNMNNTGRVGNISASTSISTMDSRDSSRSSTMNSYSVGNTGDSIANSMVDRGSIGYMSHTMAKTSIAKMSCTIAKMTTISISTIQGISISSSKCCRANQQGNLDHVVLLLDQVRMIPM